MSAGAAGAAVAAPQVHCEKGAFVGGSWVPIEECADHFCISNGSDQRAQARCAKRCRSRTSHTAAREDGTYDVVIVGAGCIGAAVARELSRYQLAVLLLEAADDVTQGATKGNSGIVHSGYDDKPGSVRARYCRPGNQMFAQLDKELHFGYEENGSLVLARDAAEEAILVELLEKGKRNGVEDLRIIGPEELRAMEPHANPNTTAALWSPHAGVVMPYEYTIALAENAADNGVEVRVRREVVAITKETGGILCVEANYWEPGVYLDNARRLGPQEILMILACCCIILPPIALSMLGLSSPEAAEQVRMAGHVAAAAGGLFLFLSALYSILGWGKGASATVGPPDDGKPRRTVPEMERTHVGGSGSRATNGGKRLALEVFRTRFVINCAGTGADRVARMVGDRSFNIQPRLGDYVLLRKEQGHLARATIFPCPHPVLGKGVLVQHTLWGNLILGPTARDVHKRETAEESVEDVFRYILQKCRDLVPSFDCKQSFHSFAGARAKSDRGDWIIGPSEACPNFVNVAGIDSPGLAGSPAIAVEVARMLQSAGLSLLPDPDFNPNRAPIVFPKKGWSGLSLDASGKRPNPDPRRNVVCKCEKVTEWEVAEACRRSLPVDSTQAVRRRTRAGMGHCQAEPCNYNCEQRVANIIARENGIRPQQVARRPWPATSLFPQRWITDKHREWLERLSWR